MAVLVPAVCGCQRVLDRNGASVQAMFLSGTLNHPVCLLLLSLRGGPLSCPLRLRGLVCVWIGDENADRLCDYG